MSAESILLIYTFVYDPLLSWSDLLDCDVFIPSNSTNIGQH